MAGKGHPKADARLGREDAAEGLRLISKALDPLRKLAQLAFDVNATALLADTAAAMNDLELLGQVLADIIDPSQEGTS